ncbi:alpha/beta fold hydrolase [Pareuzebyella sediminis]|uniref:alpha/beta fold hydrolase n=1 Tax=Pareuzebyella sediminis TaxID=2607998 RepID=UPI0018E159B7|nr:alpha/beta hydrolase [Pareuzebyella sediminis]
MPILIGISVYTCASVPKLSNQTEEAIKSVIKEPIPDMVTGKTGLASSENWNVWYESILPDSNPKGTIILIMGAANDALSWPPDFLSKFRDAGYRVIRYDHRGTGLTTQKDGAKDKTPYTLGDMSKDPIAILDTLHIQRAHVVGVSMGGMIAQKAVMKYPDRFESLTSIMSSGNIFDTMLPPMNQDILPKMISAVIKHGMLGGKKGKIKLQFVHKKILMGDATGKIEAKPLAQSALYNLEKRDGYHFIAGKKHQKAIEASGSRYDGLARLNIPVLIIHGEKDPVIPIEHGKKMASLIATSDTLWLENMGHDLPDILMDTICHKILKTIEKASLSTGK